MNGLFVGQRVRIVSASNYPYLVGAETTIVAASPETGWDWYIGILNPSYPNDSPNRYLAARNHNLEPILPQGHQPARWEDCYWQPKHMRDEVTK